MITVYKVYGILSDYLDDICAYLHNFLPPPVLHDKPHMPVYQKFSPSNEGANFAFYHLLSFIDTVIHFFRD